MSAMRIFCEPEPRVWSLAAELHCRLPGPVGVNEWSSGGTLNIEPGEQRPVSPSWKTEITLYFLPLMHYLPTKYVLIWKLNEMQLHSSVWLFFA